MWIAWLAMIPVGATATLLGPWLVFANVAVIIVSSLMVSSFECPRCGEIFARKSLLGGSRLEWLSVDHCVHCGLKRDAS
jgi:hypothetical protein